MDSFPIAQYTMLHIPRTLSDDINSVLHKMGPYLSKTILQPGNTFHCSENWHRHRLTALKGHLGADNLLVGRAIFAWEERRLRGSLSLIAVVDNEAAKSRGNLLQCVMLVV